MSYPITDRLAQKHKLKNISLVILKNFEQSGLPDSYLEGIARDLDASKNEMWLEERVLSWAVVKLDRIHKMRLAYKLGITDEDLQAFERVVRSGWNCSP
jgi:hypothetical protein